jgi:hypothetical protein
LSGSKKIKKSPLSPEKVAESVNEQRKAPEPTATGNDKIAVLKHGFSKKDEEVLGVELVIKNVFDKIIGAALFESAFYDKNGNILSTVEHKIAEIPPGVTLPFRIIYTEPERNKTKSYSVRLVKTTIPPQPTATGNDKIAILRHQFHRKVTRRPTYSYPDCVELVLRNVSGSTIATVSLEAALCDMEGNVVDTVEQEEVDIKPNSSRAVRVSIPPNNLHIIKSYDIKLTRVTTADVEKFQIRGNFVRTNEAGEEESRGTVKNLSSTKADAILIASYYNAKNENIGGKAIILRDVEPDSVRQFHFTFKPQEGDMVRTYNLKVIWDIEEYK